VKIINFNLKDLKPYFRNPRRNAKTVKALMKSIERYGFNVPLAVDRDLVLVAGHARYLALVRMGWDKPVPCIQLDLNQEKIRMYRIRDNQIHDFTEWDVDALMTEITGLHTFDDAMKHFDGAMDDVLIDLSDVVSIGDDEDVFKPTEAEDYDVLDGDGGVVVEDALLGSEIGEDEDEVVGDAGEENKKEAVTVMCPYCGEDNNV